MNLAQRERSREIMENSPFLQRVEVCYRVCMTVAKLVIIAAVILYLDSIHLATLNTNTTVNRIEVYLKTHDSNYKDFYAQQVAAKRNPIGHHEFLALEEQEKAEKANV